MAGGGRGEIAGGKRARANLVAMSAETKTLRVVHFHRRPMEGHVSIERLFAGIRRAMPDDVECSVRVCPRFSKGIWPRLVNVWDAARHQARINHITGDVHYLALALCKRRTLLTIHDCVVLERMRGLRRAVFKWLWFTLPIRRAGLVSVISEATRRELLRHVACDAAKIRVVPNCVDDCFVASPKPFNAVEPEILHLGTASNKNLERLVPALAGLPCRLNILGRLTPEQIALLEGTGIRYANAPVVTEAELVAVFQRCDMVAFVSTGEGFGLPIVEAQATGRPVVTSNVSSMPEVAGGAACLVDPLDVAAIRTGILKVWHDAEYRERLVAAGFENVKRYSARAVAAQYAALYTELNHGKQF
jgi:glycosyltransferase involved in cell wall biosynthesis